MRDLRSIADQLRSGALDEFIKRGYTLVQEEYDARAFGDSYADLKAGLLYIRFVRDRGQHWMYINSPGTGLGLLPDFYIARVLSPEARDELPGVAERLEPIVEWYLKYEPQIQRLFLPERIDETNRDLELVRIQYIQEQNE